MLITLLQEIINRALRLDPDTLRQLGDMDGKVICVRVGAGGAEPIAVFILPSQAGVRLRSDYDGKPDVAIAGDVPVFARLMLGRSSSGAVAGELQISGDIELGQQFQRTLNKIDIDWEEGASHYVGDVAAHALGRVVREMRARTRQAAGTIGQDIAEYLQEESRLLATPERVESFLKAVDELRGHVDRLEKRLQRLASPAP